MYVVLSDKFQRYTMYHYNNSSSTPTSLFSCFPMFVEYRDAFALFDKRGDNKIDSDQIGDVLRALGLNPSQLEVKKIVQEIDPKGLYCALVSLAIPNSTTFIRSKESILWRIFAVFYIMWSKEGTRINGRLHWRIESIW